MTCPELPPAIARVVEALMAPQVNVDDMPVEDPVAQNARVCARMFTNGVDVLRGLVASPAVRKLAHLMWDLVGSQQVQVCVTEEVPTVSFAALRQQGVDQGLVLLPTRWPQMVADDWLMQLGAILYVGVQVVDFCNDQLTDRIAAYRRRAAYEAELLLTIQRIHPTWEPNTYQKQVIAENPDGIRSHGVLLYEPRSALPKDAP